MHLYLINNLNRKLDLFKHLDLQYFFLFDFNFYYYY